MVLQYILLDSVALGNPLESPNRGFDTGDPFGIHQARERLAPGSEPWPDHGSQCRSVTSHRACLCGTGSEQLMAHLGRRP